MLVLYETCATLLSLTSARCYECHSIHLIRKPPASDAEPSSTPHAMQIKLRTLCHRAYRGCVGRPSCRLDAAAPSATSHAPVPSKRTEVVLLSPFSVAADTDRGTRRSTRSPARGWAGFEVLSACSITRLSPSNRHSIPPSSISTTIFLYGRTRGHRQLHPVHAAKQRLDRRRGQRSATANRIRGIGGRSAAAASTSPSAVSRATAGFRWTPTTSTRRNLPAVELQPLRAGAPPPRHGDLDTVKAQPVPRTPV